MIKLKRAVSIDSCGPEILRAVLAVDPLYANYNVDTVVTSGSELYKHSASRSAHYRGDAVDLRIKNIQVSKRSTLVNAIRRKLGSSYVVIHEAKGKAWEHIHIHWSPVFNSQ